MLHITNDIRWKNKLTNVLLKKTSSKITIFGENRKKRVSPTKALINRNKQQENKRRSFFIKICFKTTPFLYFSLSLKAENKNEKIQYFLKKKS